MNKAKEELKAKLKEGILQEIGSQLDAHWDEMEEHKNDGVGKINFNTTISDLSEEKSKVKVESSIPRPPLKDDAEWVVDVEPGLFDQ